ncbi:methyltransferase regulatory domain-containing protein [Herbaspirillum huttiense F1]|uniref:Methyltransferase regulatory domain-containing protein n=1 Tax=Herbaspirillum huttiense subsp. lycopersici TaxID=3074428 RepID=A0ABU2EUA1_9BURK|nr:MULTISPECIES: methyltransferase regulatory domain-containing protein [Herbaspirillum]MBP1313291.1 hypothetical protein [Herbaspirillum sp. 1130]MDR9851333.1 methyltransferase regulatory domain-containing protein [Herbaspirillum huttiense SE1]MDT0358246.1 methyltransferase regulatory domain-containing protein [Herbaspirillum huttiense F1]
MECKQAYVAGIDDPSGFYREASPVHLSFSCVLHGVEPVALDRPFNYLELGWGPDLAASALAAANPQGRFYAIDCRPAQMQCAREPTQVAEPDKLCVLEYSVAEVAARLTELPPMDFIALRGLYSRAGAGQPQCIVDLISRCLKPGGIVWLNYDAMPGWSPSLPLQRLIRERACSDGPATHKQMSAAREMVQQLQAAGASFFDGNPNLQYQLDSLRQEEGGYLAQACLSEGWTAFYHADVARVMAGAKMDYVGPADLAQAFPRLYLTPQQQQLLATVDDPILRETVKDYLCNTSWRSDIYLRGVRRMTSSRRELWLRQLGLSLTSLPDSLTLDLELSIGMVKADPRFYEPVLNALVRRPHSLVELAEIPALFPLRLEDIGQMAALLTASGQAGVHFLGAGELPVAPVPRLAAAQSDAIIMRYASAGRTLHKR